MAYNPTSSGEFQSLRGLTPVAVAPSQFQSSVPNLGAMLNVTPIALQPLAGWSVPSSHPEVIAQGITSGLGAIVQGIEAAYKSKEDKKEKQADRDNELKKYESQRLQKREDEEYLLRLKASLPSRTSGAGGVAPDYGSEDEGGDYESSAMSSAVPPTNEIYAPNSENPALKEQNFTPINLPRQEGAPSNDKQSKPSLLNITDPVDASAAPSPRGEQALQALANINWSQVKGSLGAGARAGAKSLEISAQAPDWLRKPNAVTAPLANLGGFPDTSLPHADKMLADAQQAYALGTSQPPESQKPSGGVPKAAFSSYSAAQRYIDSQSDNPNWYAEGAPKPNKFGKFIIPWKHHDPAAMAAREEAAGTRKQNTLNRESAMFQTHPAIKAFTSANGMQQSLPRFVKDYDAILKNPEAAGISDVGLLDMFARAEGGGRVTEGQANLALGSMGLADKARQLGYKLEGGDRLSQNQRDQMMRVIHEDHSAQLEIANQAIAMTRNKLKAQGIIDENSLPQPFIKAKTKWEATQDIASMKLNAIAIHEKQKRAEQAGDKQTSESLRKQLEEIGKSATELREKIDKSKSIIINLDEVQNTPQGWGGGAATTLIQQP